MSTAPIPNPTPSVPPGNPPEALEPSRPIGAEIQPTQPVTVQFPNLSGDSAQPGPTVLFPSVQHAEQFAGHVWQRLIDEYKGTKQFASDALGAFESDVKGMISSPSVDDVLHPSEQMRQQAAQPPQSMAEQARVQNYNEKTSDYSLPYRASAGAASAIGMNVAGAEQAAQEGKPGAVLGHAAFPLAQMAAGEAVGHIAPHVAKVAPELIRNESGEARVPLTGGERFKPQEPSSSTPSEEGYVYHATNQERAADIAKDGLKITKPHEYTDQSTWPDGAVERRNYFTKNAGTAWQFAPEEGKGAILRTKPDADFKTESTGDIYTKKVIPPNKLEILGTDGSWHPLDKAYAEQPTTYQGTERRGTPRQAPLSATELEAAIKNRKPVQTPFDVTEGASETIKADPQLRATEEVLSGRKPPVGEKPLVGPAPKKPPLSDLFKSDSGNLQVPGTAPEPPNVPTFYSKMEKVANEKVSNSATGEQVLSTLRNNGVRENEISWSGIEDFLRGKQKVSKADLQQFIKENQIQLHETNLGGEAAERNRKLAEERDKVFAENNRIWADHLRYADLLTNEEHAEYRKLEEKATRTPDDYDLKWKQNHRGQWAWHDGDTQISGAYPDETYDTQARSSIPSRRLVLEDLSPSERARYMDLKARDENNGATDLFNAMNEGRDVEKYIASLPAKIQEHARRFVETGAQIHALDKQLAENNRNAKPAQYGKYTLPGEKSNYTEKLLKLPENATFDTTKPSPEVVAKYQKQWDDVIARKKVVTDRLNQFDSAPGLYKNNGDEYRALLEKHSDLNDERDALHDQMIRETMAGKHQGNFTTSHFPEDKNILAHTRYDDRTDTEGNKLLFLEELQSDWHQKGKREGYQGPPLTELPEGYRLVNTSNANQAYEDFVQRMRQKYVSGTTDNPNLPANEHGGQWAQRLSREENAERERLARAAADSRIPPYKDWLQNQPWYRSSANDTPAAQRLYDEYKSRVSGDRWEVHGPTGTPVTGSSRSTPEQAKQDFMNRWNVSRQNKAVPNAPFKGDWHELVLKRVLREAAEKGYDKLAWVTGDQTADRYDLSKQVSEVSYDPDTEYLHAKDMTGHSVINEPMKPEKIVDYIGKEPTDKLLKQINDYKAHKQAETAKYKVEPDPGNRGKYVVRNPDGSIEMEMGPLEKDYEGPTLTREQLEQKARGLRGTQYEGQMKGLLSDMENYPNHSYKDLVLANASEGLAEILGGEFTHSRPQRPQRFDTKYDADEFIANRVQHSRDTDTGHISRIPYKTDASGLTDGYLVYNAATDKYLISDDNWTKNRERAMIHDKDAADDAVRKLNGSLPTLKGLDLKVGGTWARNLYDEKIPNFLNKYAKRWGAKVGTSTMSDPEQAPLVVMTHQQYYEKVEKPFGMKPPKNPQKWIVARDYSDATEGHNRTSLARTGAEEGFPTKEQAEEYARKENEKSGAHIKVHSIQITPAMKKSVMKEGQPISKNTAPRTLPPWMAGVRDALSQTA